jgi:hypothetical protein
MNMRMPLGASLAIAVAASAQGAMTGNAYEVGYAWSGTDFGGSAVSGYVVDLYLELDLSDVLLNVYNFNDVNIGTNYYQGLTAAGWAPNNQGSIFETDAALYMDSFISIGGTGVLAGNPLQFAGNGTTVDPNFGGNTAAGPGADGGWYNSNPNSAIGQSNNLSGVGLTGQAGVFIGRFSIQGSDGFSMIGTTGAATFNQGLGTGGVQDVFTVVPAPGALALLGLAGFAARRRR